MADDVIIPERVLYRADVIDELAFSGKEASRFLQTFGHSQGFGKPRFIYQRELRMLQLDGRLAEWVKTNCRPGRQTMRQRRGESEA